MYIYIYIIVFMVFGRDCYYLVTYNQSQVATLELETGKSWSSEKADSLYIQIHVLKERLKFP